ncbi:hypothetical protein D3C77_236600 [compost metagenome]
MNRARHGRHTATSIRADSPTRRAAVPAGPTMGYRVLAKDVPADRETIAPSRAR